MNAQEFNAWLEGFLEGKESLDKAQIELVRKKAAGIAKPLQGLSYGAFGQNEIERGLRAQGAKGYLVPGNFELSAGRDSAGVLPA